MPKEVKLLELDGKPARHCSKCGVIKVLTEFRVWRSQQAKFGRYPSCKQCCSEDNTENQTSLKADLRRHFGLTLERYTEMSNAQGNTCAICRKVCNTGNRLAVDHDHKTNVIRGLLCNNCNVAIGLLHEDEDIIWNMLEYLKKHVWSKVS